MNYLMVLFFGLFVWAGLLSAAEPIELRIGVMEGGTLAWELAALQESGALSSADFVVKTVKLADQQAGKIAMQANGVDMIVSDWIWVSSQRAEGSDLTFYPYSDVAGGLLVAADSPIKTLADLKGKKLGIAGGELDKNWLLLQALAKQQGSDLRTAVTPIYGAPPLLNQQFSRQGMDAVLTYWQFAARLQAQGYKQLLSGPEIIKQLGIEESIPSLGYVFKQSFADQHKAGLAHFFQVSREARDALCSDDAKWQTVSEQFLKNDDVASRNHQRQRYCQGRVEQWGEAQQQAAAKLYGLLHGLSNNKLTGKSAQLQNGTFWVAD